MADRRDRERQDDDLLDARGWASQHESGGGRTSLKIPDGVKMLSIKKPGTYRLDIIPYVVGDRNPKAAKGKKYWHRTYWVHRNIGPHNDSYVCPVKEANERCPICEYVAAKLRDPDVSESEEKQLYAMRPKERQLFNVIDRDREDELVMVWDQSYHTFGKYVKGKLDRMDPDEDFHFFAHPERGYTLKIGASEESAGKMKYIDCADIEFKKRKPYDWSIVDQAHCLDDMVKLLDYDELKRIFLQAPKDDDDDKPAAKSGKSKPRDDDDNDDKPAAKSRKSSRDDDDDDLPPRRRTPRDDDDDDKPAPKKKARDDDDDDDKPAPKSRPLTAEDAGLEKGDLVTYKKMECEIVSVSKDGTSLKLQDEDGEILPGISPADCTKIDLRKPAPKKSRDDDDDDDDKPAPKAKTRKAADDDDDDDKPAPKKKAAKDDDDDDLPPPRRKR